MSLHERANLPPPGGWKKWTYYVVNVAYLCNNPIHRAIYHTGFITDQNKPLGGSYACLLSAGYEDNSTTDAPYYLEFVSEITDMEKA